LDGQWRLANHGDALEKSFWPLFGNEFPSYEIYWRKYSVPLTKRDGATYSHHFKSDKELAKLSPARTKFDIDLAKLHYATLWHLTAVYRLRHLDDLLLELDSFTHCITRLSSARDTAAAFAGIAHLMGTDPEKARRAWWNAHPNERMKQLGMYRNHLVHGAPFTQLDVGGLSPLYPRIGREARYHNDWRGGFRKSDFARPEAIVDTAWSWCLRYVEQAWRAVLRVAGAPSAYQSPPPEADWVWTGGADSGITSSASRGIDPFKPDPLSGMSKPKGPRMV